MKFRTNFSFPLSILVPALCALGWSLALLLILLGVFMATTAARHRHENPTLNRDLGELRQNPMDQVKLPSMPSEQDMRELRRRLSVFRDLGAGQGRDVVSVLSRLESLLPSSARLMSFQQDQRSGEIQLVVEAESLEDLSHFLADLENDKTFTQVNLSKQSQAQGERGRWIQFSVDMMENQL